MRPQTPGVAYKQGSGGLPNGEATVRDLPDDSAISASGFSAVAVTSGAFRDALGRFASGVTVVAALDSDAKPLGVTISAFCSLSLEPPLVLFCLDKDHPLAGALTPGAVLAVNVLAEDQTAAVAPHLEQVAIVG